MGMDAMLMALRIDMDMHRDMDKAVRSEQYERAAELRDAIRALQEKQ